MYLCIKKRQQTFNEIVLFNLIKDSSFYKVHELHRTCIRYTWHRLNTNTIDIKR